MIYSRRRCLKDGFHKKVSASHHLRFSYQNPQGPRMLESHGGGAPSDGAIVSGKPSCPPCSITVRDFSPNSRAWNSASFRRQYSANALAPMTASAVGAASHAIRIPAARNEGTGRLRSIVPTATAPSNACRGRSRAAASHSARDRRTEPRASLRIRPTKAGTEGFWGEDGSMQTHLHGVCPPAHTVPNALCRRNETPEVTR